MGTWLDQCEAREQKEIDFARLYAAQYDHGTPGHLHLRIIAKLAALLDAIDGLTVTYSIERVLEEERVTQGGEPPAKPDE